jgi:hypothetical protein
MIYHIAAVTPKNRLRYAKMFHDIDLPKVRLTSESTRDDAHPIATSIASVARAKGC